MSADEEQFDGFNEATNGGDASQANTRQQPVVPPRRSARTTRHLWYRPRTTKAAAKQELSRAATVEDCDIKCLACSTLSRVSRIRVGEKKKALCWFVDVSTHIVPLTVTGRFLVYEDPKTITKAGLAVKEGFVVKCYPISIFGGAERVYSIAGTEHGSLDDVVDTLLAAPFRGANGEMRALVLPDSELPNTATTVINPLSEARTTEAEVLPGTNSGRTQRTPETQLPRKVSMSRLAGEYEVVSDYFRNLMAVGNGVKINHEEAATTGCRRLMRLGGHSGKVHESDVDVVDELCSNAPNQRVNGHTTIRALGGRGADASRVIAHVRSGRLPPEGLRNILSSTMQNFSGHALSAGFTYGVVEFAARPTTAQASFVVIPDATDDPTELGMHITRGLVDCLGFRPPRLVLSLLGASTEAEINAKTRKVLKNALSETQDTWVLTDGLNDGISRVAAQITKEIRSAPGVDDGSLPVIGIRHPSAKLVNATAGKPDGWRVSVVSTDACDLEPDTSHFVLVNDTVPGTIDNSIEQVQVGFAEALTKLGYRALWACSKQHENRYQDLIAGGTASKNSADDDKASLDFMATANAIAAVEVVVGGVTPAAAMHVLQRVEASVRNVRSIRPVVILEGTGGIADIIAYAWRLYHDDDALAASLSSDGLDRLIRKVFLIFDDAEDSTFELRSRLCNVVVVARKVKILNVNQSDGADLDRVLLEAILDNLNLAHAGHSITSGGQIELEASRAKEAFRLEMDLLRMSLSFDRAEHTETRLRNARSLWSRIDNTKNDYGCNDVDGGYVEQLNLALEWALRHDRLSHAKKLCTEIQTISSLSDFVYGQRKTRGDAELGLTLARLYEFEGQEEEQWLSILIRRPSATFQRIHAKAHPEDVVLKKVDNVWATVRQLLFDDGIIPQPLDEQKVMEECRERILDSYRGDGSNTADDANNRELLAAQELMIWAILMKRFDFAEFFWQLGGHAIPNALLCSRIAHSIAQHPGLKKRGRLSETLRDFATISDRFEEIAIGVLAACYKSDPDTTQDVLKAKMTAYRWLNEEGHSPDCLDIADLADDMDFIAHPACQAVIELEWLGATAGGVISPNEPTDSDGQSYYQDVLNSITAPITKFRLDAFFFVVLLALYSWVALAAPPPEISVEEWILFVWFTIFILEEFRQTVQSGYTWLALMRYLNDWWNLMDVAMIIVYFVGFSLRYKSVQEDSVSTARVAKAIVGFNVMQVYCRSLQFLEASKSLGPKVVILFRLFDELFQFLFLTLIFLISYGIFLQTVTVPFADPDDKTFFRLIYIPYFQIYGELMLEELADETGCLGTPGLPFSDCRVWTETLIPIITGAYLVITSIMILNMLIASFTNTYSAIESACDKVFKKNQFDLLQDYKHRTVLPVPLNIFEVTYDRLVDVSGCRRPPEPPSQSIRNRTSVVEAFQDGHGDLYLEDERISAARSPEAVLADQMNMLTTLIGHAEVFRGALSATHAQMLENERSAEYSAADYIALPWFVGVREMKRVAAEEKSKLDMRERQTSFSKAQTMTTAAQTVLWEQPHPRRQLTSLELQHKYIELNTKANKEASFRGKKLKLLLHVVTRWKRDDNGLRIFRGARPLLEFVAVKRTSTDSKWSLPELPFSENGEEPRESPIVAQAFVAENFVSGVSAPERAKILRKLQDWFVENKAAQESAFCYEGRMADPRCVQGQHVEVKVEQFHDSSGSLLNVFDLNRAAPPVSEVTWATAHRYVDLVGEEEDFIEQLAHMHGAYW